jgi:monofunctional biosynthetic peptidoglycan transglycosylase
MERVLSKERILEIYLNVIEWGNGVFGAEAAAKKYFGKSASTITREEAARLAAVIPSPLRHQPNQPSQYVERRASLILERMTARGY